MMRRYIDLIENVLASSVNEAVMPFHASLGMPFSGRRGEIPSGARFLLDPSPGEFAGYFRGFDGAAFYATAEHISFGAAKDGSIDHDMVADAFALGNDEVDQPRHPACTYRVMG